MIPPLSRRFFQFNGFGKLSDLENVRVGTYVCLSTQVLVQYGAKIRAHRATDSSMLSNKTLNNAPITADWVRGRCVLDAVAGCVFVFLSLFVIFRDQVEKAVIMTSAQNTQIQMKFLATFE